MTDRADFLRRAGAGAAGLSLAGLLGPGAALAGGGGGGDFPAHPRWRFVFVSYDTLDPLLVASQFGAEDAASLVNCAIQWTGSANGSVAETVSALRKAVAGKADGIAVAVVDPQVFIAPIAAAVKAKIPVVAFHVDVGRIPSIGFAGENPSASGLAVAAEVVRLVPRSSVLLFVPQRAPAWIARRALAVTGGLSTAAAGGTVTRVLLGGDVGRQQAQVENAYRSRTGIRGLVAVDGTGTLAVARAIKNLGLQGKVRAGGWDLLPDDLAYVADGTLDFVVDQGPYLQGFAPVVQLFLAKISEGIVSPAVAETSGLLRKADVATFLATKSRFEGSSSRHEYPLRRA